MRRSSKNSVSHEGPKPSSSKTFKSFFRKPLSLRPRLSPSEQEAISQANSRTLLLSLPTEIRQQIWECSIGGNVIDVSEHPKPNTNPPRHSYNICANDRICTIANFFRLLDNDRRMWIRTTSSGNITCSTGGRSGKTKRWLSLFFVCRQIYADAKDLVWSGNLLFFWSVQSLEQFVTLTRPLRQAATIKSIALVVDPSNVMRISYDIMIKYGDINVTESESTMALIASSLTGLKRLCLFVKVPLPLIWAHNDRKGLWKNLKWLRGITTLRSLGLQEVRVMVEVPKEFLIKYAGQFPHGIEWFKQQFKITKEDCEAYAREVEAALLSGSNTEAQHVNVQV